MNKSTFLSLVLSGAVLVACDTESEYHNVNILSPKGQKYIFADQNVDSITFFVTDDWRLSTESSWARVSDAPSEYEGTVPSAYYVQATVPVYFSGNDTGRDRYADFHLRSYGNLLTVRFVQTAWHDIQTPASRVAEFKNTDSEETGVIEFNAYSDWEVDNLNDADWITVPTTAYGRAGARRVEYTVQPLPAGVASRQDTILLRSYCGAKTPIVVKQAR